MARHLFIVARDHQGLYDYLLERFANDAKVTVIMDRRVEGQQQDHRERDERRQNPQPENEPWPRSHQIITLEDSVSAR